MSQTPAQTRELSAIRRGAYADYGRCSVEIVGFVRTEDGSQHPVGTMLVTARPTPGAGGHTIHSSAFHLAITPAGETGQAD